MSIGSSLQSANAAKPTFIDLFCGCGGFTLGMLRAGFDCLAAIDFNQPAVDTLKANLADKKHPDFTPVRHALQRDLTAFQPAELAELIGTKQLDVIVGGPPCQGFSTARQRDGSNHGTERLKEDPRRHLFRNFLDFVEFFQPKVFVIENVLGLRAAGGGRYFTAVQYEARILGRAKGLPGYRVHPQIERGEELGSPQKRRRQLIVGVRDDLAGYFNPRLQPAARAVKGVMLGDAILDLPKLAAGEGENETPYDLKHRSAHFLGGTRDHLRAPFLARVAEVSAAEKIFNHVSRPHSDRDLRDFARIPQGSSSAVQLRKGVEFEFPYDKTSFKDRYTRQHRNRPCSTIVAHLAKDGLMFIHPTQNRSLTPREAARVQTFPDWFVFPEARTHSFRVIGNAVPPLIGEAVGQGILRFFTGQTQPSPAIPPPSAVRPPATPAKPQKNQSLVPDIPLDHTDAARRIAPFTEADKRALRAMSTRDFLRGWHALLWLFPHLHPDNAVEHGDEAHEVAATSPELGKLGARYVRSGWPVMLAGFGEEAWRRFENEDFSDELFYCVEAQSAGLEARLRLAAQDASRSAAVRGMSLVPPPAR
jgi:DNA (cytosine-5)-methyltransferase 1